MTQVLVLNGPNLNMLGTRQPEIYGNETLADVEATCIAHGKSLNLEVTCAQSNHEGELVTLIQNARGKAHGIVINAGAYTHTSVAIHDALKMADMPIIELHISNVFQREEFRHHSYISSVATGSICGLGTHGYTLALDAIARLVKTKND